MRKYYEGIKGIDINKIIYAGNIIFNSKKIREDKVVERFKSLSKNKYRFQDLDILNIACKGKITYLNPEFCLTTYIMDLAVNKRSLLYDYWDDIKISEALSKGIVHYNGQKPWKGFCVNFDIWWEYYRKSPFFDEKFYFEFFYSRLNELDQLSLWKRIKIIVRYFVYGKREI
jgi:UDP-glucose:(galactosyl)LPS alpha-1,2-glucosyltransferase